VFVREFVPQRIVATLARWVYNEPYRAVPMRSSVTEKDNKLSVEHRLVVGGRERTIGVVADAVAHRPRDDSVEAFLIEHQWGFGTSRRGKLVRYQVTHQPWDVRPVTAFYLHWDWEAAYGPRFANLQVAEPVSIVLAVGSPVEVYPKGWLTPMREPHAAGVAPATLASETSP
jgi:hypothetical protein